MSGGDFFLKTLRQQSFQPGLLGIFINPFYFIRKGLYKHIAKNTGYLTGNMLDFGCGRKPYKNLIHVTNYVGVDVEVSGHSHANSEIDVFYDGKHLPFPDEHFESLFCSEVFEHVFNFDEILKEINRVLKRGATGVITTPFAWPEHEQPFDFTRFTSFSIKMTLEKNGFKIISMEKNGHFFEALVQLTACYVYTILHKKNKVWNGFITLLFISPINILGALFSAIAPKSQDYFHNMVIVVEKI